MSTSVRALQSVVAAATFLVTSLGTGLGWLSSSNLDAFITQWVPFPLLYPLVGGLGFIFVLQFSPAFVSAIGEDGSGEKEEADDVGGGLTKHDIGAGRWNSRGTHEETQSGD